MCITPSNALNKKQIRLVHSATWSSCVKTSAAVQGQADSKVKFSCGLNKGNTEEILVSNCGNFEENKVEVLQI